MTIKTSGDEHGNESEEIGIQFCIGLLGGNWKQTSYNANFRKNYASIGDTYDENRDAFINIKPFDSWVLNEDNYQWVAPIPYPNDDNEYSWDEETISWIKILEG
jgi:hypothetical protein